MHLVWGGYEADDDDGAGPSSQWVRPCMGTEMNFHEHMNLGGFDGLDVESSRLHTLPNPVPQRGRTVRVQGHFPELSELSQSESEDGDDANIMNVGNEALKHAYRDETWSQRSFTYDPKPREFLGRRGSQKFFAHMPTILTLFELFWPFNLLRKIVIETNRYATESLDAHGSTRGGPKWETLTVPGLKAFLAIHMYMSMKRQPNYKSYWEKEGIFFHCPIISNIMTRERFIQLQRCLHITNPNTYEHIPKGDPLYDKLRQVRWLVEEIRNACMRVLGSGPWGSSH
jgi:hypothetical protein